MRQHRSMFRAEGSIHDASPLPITGFRLVYCRKESVLSRGETVPQ